ncbi:MAG: hypothetical protein R2940_11535 [Syntrophotaleaceae bacterium]
MKIPSMDKQLITLFTVLLLLFFLPWGRINPVAQEQNEFTDQFPIRDCNFRSHGSNAFFDITPGRTWKYSNLECFNSGECASLEEMDVSVLDQTLDIPLQIEGLAMPINARVVVTEKSVDGQMVETRSDYYAECRETQDVYHFGASVQTILADGSTSTEGSWLAARDDALPGLAFPGGAFLLGSRYRREQAPGVVLSSAHHDAMGLEVTVPFGTFTGCVEVRETDGLDPGRRSTRTYCPGIGLVKQDDTQLLLTTGIIPAGDAARTVPNRH